MSNKAIGLSMLGIFGVMSLIQFINVKDYVGVNWLGTIAMIILFVVGIVLIILDEE